MDNMDNTVTASKKSDHWVPVLTSVAIQLCLKEVSFF